MWGESLAKGCLIYKVEKVLPLASLKLTKKFELRGAELSRIYLKVGKVLQEEKAL